MTQQAESDDQLAAMRAAVARADLTVEQLWLRYFALGGSDGPIDIEGYLEGLLPLSPQQRDILAVAVNERLDELFWPHRVPYVNSVREPLPRAGALTALVQLLEETRARPSERLAAVAVEAGRALGVDATLYLVDDDQRVLTLVPDTPVTPQPAEQLGVDATLAGRAFRSVETIASATDGEKTLWVPLLDDVERLGVVKVVVRETRELFDPALRRQCEWFAHLLAHLVALETRYGDVLDAYRRDHPRTAAAELTWQIVPPTTAGVPGITVAAQIEPSDRAGGDAFDYALSTSTAQISILDAMGHNLSAGLIAATALAGLRAARRAGRDLNGQAEIVDELIRDSCPANAYVTGVLATIDLDTGVLTYLSAGHIHPLILRNGRIVRRLDGGRRLPFGFGSGPVVVAEEALEPGDWVILHTDGITDARDHTGEFFGEERLSDFLRREAASGHPPPETVRRLLHAILDHHHGTLNDDATVLIARWAPSG
jgi:serine phosphatase RsbU (regulator of sigma subunit)